MNAHSDDFDMTDDLRSLSQAYRDAMEYEDEPSPAIDAAILAAAHRAVASRPQAVPPAGPPLRFTRWQLPLALAASVLVGVLVATLFVSEKTEPGVPALAHAPQALPVPEQPPPAQISPSPQESMDVMVESKPSVAKPTDAPIHTGSADMFSKLPDTMLERQVVQKSARRTRLQEAPEQRASMQAPPQGSQALPTPESSLPTQISPPLRSGMDDAMRVRAAVGAAGSPDTRAEKQMAQEMVQPTVQPFAESAQEAPMDRDAVVTTKEKAASTMPMMKEKPEKQQDPRVWLEEIEKLRRDGKIKEARKSLTEFRKHYPDHELPKALRDL